MVRMGGQLPTTTTMTMTTTMMWQTEPMTVFPWPANLARPSSCLRAPNLSYYWFSHNTFLKLQQVLRTVLKRYIQWEQSDGMDLVHDLVLLCCWLLSAPGELEAGLVEPLSLAIDTDCAAAMNIVPCHFSAAMNIELSSNKLQGSCRQRARKYFVGHSRNVFHLLLLLQSAELYRQREREYGEWRRIWPLV